MTITDILNQAIEAGATRNQAISALIVTIVDLGFTVEQAIDAVMGGGTYDSVVTQVYNELRA